MSERTSERRIERRIERTSEQKNERKRERRIERGNGRTSEQRNEQRNEKPALPLFPAVRLALSPALRPALLTLALTLCLTLALTLWTASPAYPGALAAEKAETLRVQGLSQSTFDGNAMEKVNAKWYTEYVTVHPEIDLKLNPKYPYKTTKSMMSALEKGKLKADVFTLWSHVHNTERFMDEGYCCDLSNNAALMDTLGQMYPAVQRAVTRNGKVYAMPISLSAMDYLVCDPTAWAELGLPEEEKPASFTGLLDFLEAWPERFPQRPMVSVNAYWDAEHCDNEHVYTHWLVGLLVRHYARQCEAQGQPVDFDAPLFRALLDRCKTVGDALYGHDGLQDPYYLFCEMIGSSTNLVHCIPMRMTDDDPIRLGVEMICLCVSPKGDRQPQAEALIASYMSTLLAQDGTKSATEEDYDMPRAQVELFASLEQPLVSGDGGYILDQAELDRYRELAQYFYFPMPGAFDSRAGGTNDIRLRFSRGVISAEQYVKELKRFVK